MVRGSIDDALREAKGRGIKNILALRGDPPRGEEYWIATDPRFTHAIDLVQHIRSTPEFASHFCIGVAAYPDGHPDHGPEYDEDEEIECLKKKVDAGADFVITQLFYDVDRFLEWVGKVRARGITVPILPGIMPIQTYASFIRLSKLTRTRVPDELTAALEPICHDDALVKDFGVTLAISMIKRLTTEGGLPGVHFCTLNLEKSVQRVLEEVGWTGHHEVGHNAVILDSADLANVHASSSAPPPPPPLTNGVTKPSPLRNGSITPSPPDETHTTTESDSLILPAREAVSAASAGLTSFPNASSHEAGRGELNAAASWDDFPNGRFGDFKSPAWGDQGPWGNNALYITADQSTSWGSPHSIEALTTLFSSYLSSHLPSTPFSPLPLSPDRKSVV